jgi:hypothetical protein
MPNSQRNTSIILFEEDRLELQSYNNFTDLVEFSIDNNFEIIAGCSNEDLTDTGKKIF